MTFAYNVFFLGGMWRKHTLKARATSCSGSSTSTTSTPFFVFDCLVTCRSWRLFISVVSHWHAFLTVLPSPRIIITPLCFSRWQMARVGAEARGAAGAGSSAPHGDRTQRQRPRQQHQQPATVAETRAPPEQLCGGEALYVAVQGRQGEAVHMYV